MQEAGGDPGTIRIQPAKFIENVASYVGGERTFTALYFPSSTTSCKTYTGTAIVLHLHIQSPMLCI